MIVHILQVWLLEELRVPLMLFQELFCIGRIPYDLPFFKGGLLSPYFKVPIFLERWKFSLKDLQSLFVEKILDEKGAIWQTEKPHRFRDRWTLFIIGVIVLRDRDIPVESIVSFLGPLRKGDFPELPHRMMGYAYTILDMTFMIAQATIASSVILVKVFFIVCSPFFHSMLGVYSSTPSTRLISARNRSCSEAVSNLGDSYVRMVFSPSGSTPASFKPAKSVCACAWKRCAASSDSKTM